MQYSDIDQETLDIDWYAVDSSGLIAHFASGGTKLPISVANHKEDNEIICAFFDGISENSIAHISRHLDQVESFKSQAERDRYLVYFMATARKGIYSFDKSNLGNFNDEKYHLVAFPDNPMSLQELPANIQRILERTRIPFEIKEQSILLISELDESW